MDEKSYPSARVRAVAGYLRPVSLGLFLLYSVYAAAHLMLLPPPANLIMMGIAGASAFSFLVLFFSLRYRPDWYRHTHQLAIAIALVVWLNCSVQMYCVHSPGQTNNFLIFFIAMGSFFLWPRTLLWMLTLSWMVWLGDVLMGPLSRSWIHQGIHLITASVLSILILFARLKDLIRIERARDLLQRARDQAIAGEQRFRRLSEASGEGVVIYRNGIIEDVNSRFAALFRLPMSQLIGSTVFSFINPVERESVERYLRTPQTSSIESVALRADHSTFPVKLRQRQLSDSLRVLTFCDLTDSKKAQELIVKQQQLLFRAEKMSALGEMAAGIAHEINNPLTSIGLQLQLFAKFADHETPNPGQIRWLVRRVSGDVARINRIIKSVRTLSRETGTEAFERVPLGNIVQESVELCQERLVSRGIKLVVKPIPVELLLLCNPTQIMQVLVNLMSNAQDAVEKLSERWIRIEGAENDHFVEISVTDSGQGIPSSIRDQIMTPFFTTKESGKGTGLGLSISRRILEFHGGTLLLDPDYPHTRFVIRLPSHEIMVQKNAS